MSFDRIARHFQWMEYLAFGRAMEACRFRHLNALAECRRILLLGEGDGRFLAKLLHANRHATIDCLDASGEMLARARSRAVSAELGRVRFIQADALTHDFATNGPYDAIVTHYFLDCFQADALSELVPRIAAAAAPDATWLLSDFQTLPRGFQHWRSRCWLRILYTFFGVTTGLKTHALVDPSPLLTANGFQKTEHWCTRGGLMKSELWRRSTAGP